MEIDSQYKENSRGFKPRWLTYVFAAIGLFAVYFIISNNNREKENVSTIQNRPNIEIEKLESKSAIKELPANFPIESGARTVKAFTAQYGGREQITYQYLSAKSIEQNYLIFKEYLGSNSVSSNGLLSDDKAGSPLYKSISALTKLGRVIITLNKTGAGSDVAVDVTFMPRNKINIR